MRVRAVTAAAAVATVVIVAVAIIAAVAGPVRVGEPVLTVGQEPTEPAAPELTEPASAPEEPDAEHAPELFSVGVIVLTIVVLGFVLVTLVAVFVVGLRVLLDALRARAPERLSPRDPAIRITEALHDAAEEGARDVATAPSGQAGDAVVQCWVALEQAAQHAGTPRDPATTPTEFTAALLAEHSADPEAVRTLLRLYHRARFGDGELPDQAAVFARDALHQISDGLSASLDGRTS